MTYEEIRDMDLKDKRLVNQMDIEDQNKYMKNIADTIPDCKDKFEEFEVAHSPINLFKKIKRKQLDEGQKEKTSSSITANK